MTTAELRAPLRALEAFLLATVSLFLLQLPFERTMRDLGHGMVGLQRATSDEAARIVADWGGQGGAGVEAARMQLLVDMLFLVAYPAATVAACWCAWRVVSRRELRAVLVATGAAAAAAGVLDVAENARLYRVLDGERLSTATIASLKLALALGSASVALVALLLSLRVPEARAGWRDAHRGWGRRLLGLPEAGQPLAVEPLVRGQQDTVAICCSGGGIRSASFNLGVLQHFMRHGVYQQASVISAVSGGAYTASALSLTRAHSDQGALTEELPAFAQGSPEERRLRANMHYLAPDGRTTGVGVLALLYGFFTHLGVILLAVFVGARLLGWCLHTWARPEGFTTASPALELQPWTWLTSLVLVGLGAAHFVLGDKVAPIYLAGPGRGQLPTAVRESVRTWSLRLLAAGAVLALLVLAVPGAVLGLNRLALDNAPDRHVAELVSDLGFTTNEGCQQAARDDYREERDRALREARSQATEPAAVSFRYGACGQVFSGRVVLNDLAGSAGAPALENRYDEKGQDSGGGLAATLVALLALIKTSLGKVGAREEPEAPKGRVRSLLGALPPAVRGIVAPWVGSVVAVLLLVVVALRVAGDAMLEGVGFTGLWRVMAVAAMLLVLPFFTDANRTSLHGIYRERLSTVFAVRRRADGTAEQIPYERPLLWTELPEAGGAPEVAGPELVINATVNAEDVGFVPPGRGGAPFAFTRTAVGIGTWDTTRWAATEDYQRAAGPGVLTVPAAVAISGAAVSPVMGRMTRRPVRLLLGLANVRLGVWLPNPEVVPRLASSKPDNLVARAVRQWRAPGVTWVVREVLGRNSIRRRYVYVTDGGHYDNLGLVEALRRQPALLLVIDGSGDTPPHWTTLGHAFSLARAELGAEVVLDQAPPKPKDGAVASNVATGWVTYADGARGRIVVGKAVRTTSDLYDLDVYGQDDPSFPNKSTGDQLFGDLEFESYLRLGRLTGERMLAALEDEE